MVDVDEVFAAAVCDVEGLAGGGMGCAAGTEVGLDNIVNVSEVAALATVTVDGGTLVVQQLLDELGDDSGVGTVGVLTAAEDVEVTEAVGVEAVVHGVLLRPLLVAALGKGVRGEEVSFHAFALGEMCLVAIDGAGGGIDEFLHAVLTGGLEHVEGAGDVVGAVKEGHLDAAGNAAPGGLVEDVIDAFSGSDAGVEVFDVTLDELISWVVQKQVHIGLLACGEVVEATDAIPEVKDGLTEVGTDEAGAAGDKEQPHPRPLSDGRGEWYVDERRGVIMGIDG